MQIDKKKVITEIMRIEKSLKNLDSFIDKEITKINQSLSCIKELLGNTKNSKNKEKDQGTKGHVVELEYDELVKLIRNNQINDARDKLTQLKKEYLDRFCRSNNITIDISKMNKNKIVDIILQNIMETHIITK